MLLPFEDLKPSPVYSLPAEVPGFISARARTLSSRHRVALFSEQGCSDQGVLIITAPALFARWRMRPKKIAAGQFMNCFRICVGAKTGSTGRRYDSSRAVVSFRQPDFPSARLDASKHVPTTLSKPRVPSRFSSLSLDPDRRPSWAPTIRLVRARVRLAPAVHRRKSTSKTTNLLSASSARSRAIG